MLKSIKNFLLKLRCRKIVKYVGTTEATFHKKGQLISTKTFAVYKLYNPDTGKIYKLWAEGHGDEMEFNVDVFQHSNKLIEK